MIINYKGYEFSLAKKLDMYGMGDMLEIKMLIDQNAMV